MEAAMLNEVDVPPVPVLLEKVSRQAKRISNLEKEVSRLQAEAQVRDLEKSREEEAAEAVLRELDKLPVGCHSEACLSFLNDGEKSINNANDVRSVSCEEGDQDLHHQENYRYFQRENGRQSSDNNNYGTALAVISKPPVWKDTISSTEHKYQLLVNRFNAQAAQMESLKSELASVKKSKRRTSYTKWEADSAEERVRKLETYVRALEQSRTRAGDENENTEFALTVLELERYRSEARELREVLADARRELTVLRERSSKTETVLRNVACAAKLDGYSTGKEELLVTAMDTAHKRANYSHNLAIKAKTLLNVALEERDRLESIFRTARREGKASVQERAIAVMDEMESHKHCTLGRSHPELTEHLRFTTQKLQMLTDQVKTLEKEQHRCYRIISGAIDKSSDLLGIPVEKRTTFDSLSAGATLLARLTLSQLQDSPQKEQ